MKRLATLIFQYYRLLLFNNLMFSIMCGVLISLKISGSLVNILFIAKLIGFIGASGHYYYMHGNNYYYFRNAGVSIRRLYTYSFVIDLILYLLFFTAYTLLTDVAVHFKN